MLRFDCFLCSWESLFSHEMCMIWLNLSLFVDFSTSKYYRHKLHWLLDQQLMYVVLT